MKLLIFVIAFPILISVTFSQELPIPQSLIISKLEADVKTGKKDAVPNFWMFAEQNGTPLIEPIEGDKDHSLVTFIWRGDAQTKDVLVQSPYFPWNMAKRRMKQIGDSGVWYKTTKMPNDSSVVYQFSVNDPRLPFGDPYDWYQFKVELLNDPLNKKHFTYAKDEDIPDDFASTVSVLDLPLAVKSPFNIYNRESRHGDVIKTQFKSKILPDERRIWFYTPPGYSASAKYPLIIFLDGWDYLNHIPAQTMLDNLITAGKIRPVIAAFVATPIPTGVREKEYYGNPKFADFVADELFPLIHSKFSVLRQPDKTTIVGLSASGFAAAYVALNHPDKIGNVIMQSPALWWGFDYYGEDGEWLTQQFINAPKVKLNFYLEVGRFEVDPSTRRGRPNPLHSARHFRDMLKLKGYKFSYVEYSGAHAHLNWRESLPDHLIRAFSKE